jgi:hypothetical protein
LSAQAIQSHEHSNVQFDEISKLDKPNIDWVATLALNEARIALTQAFLSDDGKQLFIGAIEALMENTLYYWMLDPTFLNYIAEIEDDQASQHQSIPPGYSADPNTGLRRLDIDFSAARKKYARVMIAVTKATKSVPFIDFA